MSKASVRQKHTKSAAKKQNGGGHVVTYLWLSRIFSLACFGLIGLVAVLSLSLIHITKEAEVYSVLATAPMYSENLAYFDPLHPEMNEMDILNEMYVRQYVTARNNVLTNAPEMRRQWGGGGIVRYMSTPDIYETFVKREVPRYFPDDKFPPDVMIETDIKKIIKEGWNSWQIFFDTRKMKTATSVPEIDHWIATIQFRYYSRNVVMFRRLRNPLGFTVTQYNLARQKK